MMFKTKSLTPIKPSFNKKQKKYTHNSLRSLIADKTVRYHQQFQKIVLDDNHLAYSGNKKQLRQTINADYQSYTKRQNKIRIKQFQLPKDKQNTQQQIINNNDNKQIISSQQSPCRYLQNYPSITLSYQKSQLTPKLQQISQIPYQSPNNSEHRIFSQMRSIMEQHNNQVLVKQKYLQEYKQIVGQYEKQIQFLKCKNQELQTNNRQLCMKNRQLQDKLGINQQEKGLKVNFTNEYNIKIQGTKIQIVKQNKCINTDMLSDDIVILNAHKLALQAKNTRLSKQLQNIQSFIIRDTNNIHQNILQQPNIDQQQQNNNNSILKKIQKYHNKHIEAHKNQVQLFKQVNNQVKIAYQKKVSQLVKLLGDAQQQIKVLLHKLRLASDNSVVQYRKSNRLAKSMHKSNHVLTNKENISLQ